MEAVDAVLLSLECVLNEHVDMQRDAGLVWKTAHDKLRHRREKFRSTKLQLSSTNQRLKNVINLVSHPSCYGIHALFGPVDSS